MLLGLLILALATHPFSRLAFALATLAAAAAAPLATKATCPTGECCEFKLREYQRCVPLDNFGAKEVQTWPLFFDFLGKDQKPIQPITGDYNMKACLPEECHGQSVGNITGPDDFYMRWQYKEMYVGNGWANITYWYRGVDHTDFDRCVIGDWTEYQGDFTKWVKDCENKENSALANRTRVRSVKSAVAAERAC
jgi:hypothetical protein